MRDQTGEILTIWGKDSVARINPAENVDITENNGNYLSGERLTEGLV
jgi:hypothetical protein